MISESTLETNGKIQNSNSRKMEINKYKKKITENRNLLSSGMQISS